MLTLNELANDAAVLAQRSGDTDYITKIKVWIRLDHKTLSEIYDYYNELQAIHNFNTVASQESYPLPNRFDKPFRLYDLTNNKKVLPDVEEVYFDSNIANITDAVEGTPEKYRIYGVTGVSVPISTSGDTVQVKSSSSSDTSNPIVRVRGFIDSARLIEDFEDITISSSSPTTFVAGTTTFYEITHVSKSANTTGFITITNSSSVTLETLAPKENVARHKIMKLGKIPDSINSMRLLFKKTVSELSDDNDYPFVESDKFLIFSAAASAFRQDKENQRALDFTNQADKALAIILNNQNNKMGPAYQRKIINVWLQNHRVR